MRPSATIMLSGYPSCFVASTAGPSLSTLTAASNVRKRAASPLRKRPVQIIGCLQVIRVEHDRSHYLVVGEAFIATSRSRQAAARGIAAPVPVGRARGLARTRRGLPLFARA